MAWWNKILSLEVVIKNVYRYYLMVPYRNVSCDKYFTYSRQQLFLSHGWTFPRALQLIFCLSFTQIVTNSWTYIDVISAREGVKHTHVKGKLYRSSLLQYSVLLHVVWYAQFPSNAWHMWNIIHNISTCLVHFDREILYRRQRNIIAIIYIGASIFLVIGILHPPTTNILTATENHFPLQLNLKWVIRYRIATC